MDFELLQRVFETTSEGILIIDDQNRVSHANLACELMFGYARNKLVQKPLNLLFPGNSNLKFIEQIKSRQTPETDKKNPISPLLGRKKNGSQFPLKVRLVSSVDLKPNTKLLFLEDLTAKAIIEQDLRATETKHLALLEAIPDTIFILDYKGNCIEFQEGRGQKFPINNTEAIGKKIVELFPPEIYTELHQAIKKAIKLKASQHVNYEIQEDELKYFEARLAPMNNHSILGIVRDVSRAKKSENDLRAEKKRLRRYLDIAGSMFVAINKNHKIELVNQKTCEVLGYTEKQLVGKDWFKTCIPEEDQHQVTKQFDKILARKNHTEEYYENPVLTSKKDLRLIQWRNSVLTDENGKAIATLSSGEDVTDLKITQEILFTRKRALDATSNAVIIVDAQKPEQPIIYCNRAFQHMTGYSEEEILGRNCRFLQNDDRAQDAIPLMRSAISKGKGCKVELRNYRKDGKLFWNELSVTPICDSKGRLTHFIGVQNDITKRKREEILKNEVRGILESITKNRPLKKIALQFTSALEHHIPKSRATILVFDHAKGTLSKLVAPNIPEKLGNNIKTVKVGPKASCPCGQAAFLKEEVIVKNLSDEPLFEKHADLSLEGGFKACWSIPIFSSTHEILGTFALYSDRKGAPKKREIETLRDMAQLTGLAIEHHNINLNLERSGKILQKYAQTLEQRVYDRTKEVQATIAELTTVNKNLEEQIQSTKAAEKKVKTSQQMLSAIARNFPKGIIVVFNEVMDFVYIEGEELRKLKLNKTDFEGKNIDEISLFSEKRREKIKEDIQKTLNGKHLSFEVEYRKEVYSANSTPLYSEKDTSWALFVYSNITAQKLVEVEIRKTLEKEKELSELKSRFVSMASHEFRTPLSAILSSAILIGKQNTPDKLLKREKYVSQIKNNVRNLVMILNDFLSLSKLEEGKTLARPQFFDLMQLARSIVEEITIGKKAGPSISVAQQGEASLVFLDPKLIRHTLINLLSNALKYSEPEAKCTLTIIWRNKEVELQVSDQGIGIPEAEQSHLFERFFRAKNAENIQGTGLGLHIVRQYTELMGGTVNFISKEGVGTTFMLKFPNRQLQLKDMN